MNKVTENIIKPQSCLLFLYSVINTARGCLMCPEQTDGTGLVGIECVSCFISDHQVQPKNPEQHRTSDVVIISAYKTLQWCFTGQGISLQYNWKVGSRIHTGFHNQSSLWLSFWARQGHPWATFLTLSEIDIRWGCKPSAARSWRGLSCSPIRGTCISFVINSSSFRGMNSNATF